MRDERKPIGRVRERRARPKPVKTFSLAYNVNLISVEKLNATLFFSVVAVHVLHYLFFFLCQLGYVFNGFFLTVVCVCVSNAM